MKKATLIALVTALCGILLCGCSFSFVYPTYDNAAKYSVGGAELTDEIERVDISWVRGNVIVATHTENTVAFSEQANLEVDESLTMHYWLDGKTLHIKFAQSGKIGVIDLRKTLTVFLPQELMLKYLTVNVISANVSVDGVTAQSAEFDSVSGEIDIANTQILQLLEIDTVSGELTASLKGTLDELEVDTVSGDIEITAEKIGTVDLDSTSGRVKLNVISQPDEIDIDTVSGAVSLYLPSDSSFTLNFDTVSGSFDCDLPTTKRGDNYICGGGLAKYKIDTVSGSLKIKINSSVQQLSRY